MRNWQWLNICNDCNYSQEAGECAVCPHMPWEGKDSHYARRPCRACGSANLRSAKSTITPDGEVFLCTCPSAGRGPVVCMSYSDNGYDASGQCGCRCHGLETP